MRELWRSVKPLPKGLVGANPTTSKNKVMMLCSSAVERMAVNHHVVGSTPTKADYLVNRNTYSIKI